jgi:hypothetical protein
MAMAMPPRLMIVAGTPRKYMADEGESDGEGQLTMGKSALRAWSKKIRITTPPTTPPRRARASASRWRSISPCAIVGRTISTPSAATASSSSAPHAIDHGERVLAVPRDHDGADRLALAVELGEAAAHVSAHRTCRRRPRNGLARGPARWRHRRPRWSSRRRGSLARGRSTRARSAPSHAPADLAVGGAQRGPRPSTETRRR